jgi:hypothetical protein
MNTTCAFSLVSPLALFLAACSSGGETSAPAPTSAPTTISLQGGPQAGGLGALPGNNGPGISGPGNVPVPGAAQPASPGAGSYTAGRPAGTAAPGAASTATAWGR